MRFMAPVLFLSLVACEAGAPTPAATPKAAAAPKVAAPDPVAPAVTAMAMERMTGDTPRTTVAGNTFVAPAGWDLGVRGPATILAAPEGDVHVAIVDVQAADADAAVAAAWQAYRPEMGPVAWPVRLAVDEPDADGWTMRRAYTYQTSPNERRDVAASVRRGGDGWTVVISDLAQATGEKRGAQLQAIVDRLLPKGQARESFAGKPAQRLDASRIAALTGFVASAREQLKLPGVAFGVIQDGVVVFAGGYGVRELGDPTPVGADTRFIVASNTKAMTTLMLARLVDAGKLTWDTPATASLPAFKLGDAATTGKVQVRHLICACTGMPRQDMEWLLQFGDVTPQGALALLGTMQPTSAFGELYQYSNPLAAAAGYIGGHVAYPKLELGAAYDEAMQTEVFAPLGMAATTLDFAKAQQGDFARAHAVDIEGEPARVSIGINESVVPVRPAGGAWSTVNDMLKYVQMELAEGELPGGAQYLKKETLLARRAPQVAIGGDASYGMGLIVDRKYEVEVVYHGGDMIGFHSDMMWLPAHGVGAVVLTNGDPGWLLRTIFLRKLLEVLFDGRAEADAQVAAEGKSFFAAIAAERRLLTVPAIAEEAAELAPRYRNPALGELVVRREGTTTWFDFGEWKSEVGSRRNPDGSVSFVTIVTGMTGLELVVGAGEARTLVLRDPQHEYVFTAG